MTETETTAKTQCDRCTTPVGEIIECVFARDGYGEEVMDACEACRPLSHYSKCQGCKREFVSERLISHEDRSVLPPNYKSKSLCAPCKATAVKLDERVLAGYPPEAHGDEHYFYDVPYRH